MNIFTSIVLPLICSLIGGVLTLLGVVITNKHDNKINRNNYKLENKPLFYPIDVTSENKRKSIYVDISCSLNNKKEKESSIGLYGAIKNTDKALLIIKKITINNKEYHPDNSIFEKNKLISIYVFKNKKIKSDDNVVLTISDFNDNEYNYKVFFAINEKDNKNEPAYIVKFEEI